MKKIALVAFMMLAVYGNAAALLFDGQTVNFQYHFPSIDSYYSSADNGNYLVGPGAEVINVVDGYGPLDISDTNISMVFDRPVSFSGALYNGFELIDINGVIPDFTSVTINPLTNANVFNQSNITFDSNHIWVNWQGLSFDSGTLLSLDVNGSSNTAPVPEPATMMLIGSGLLGLAGFRKKIQK